MKTIFIQPGDLISDLDDADGSQDRHLHLVLPAPVCPDIEELCFCLEKPYIVSFEPDSVLLPRLSSIEGQSESGEVWERLFDVIDAPVLTEIRIGGFGDIPASVFQKTSLKIIDLDSARGPVSIPDDIRNLVNLESFKLWRAEVSCMSPELFRLPRIRDISFYRVYGYEPTPEVIAAAEAFEAAGGRFSSADEAGDIFPHRSKQRAAPEVSPGNAPPDPGQERPVIAVEGEALTQELPPDEIESECLDGTKPLSKTAGMDKNRRFGRLAYGIPRNALETEPFQQMPKILIADDNAIKRKLLSCMLGKLGCRPEFVSNGVECVERLKTEDFDMILMDFQMPVMDGCQAAREIRALGKSVWITGLTYNGSPDVISLCTNSGMDDCLVFPYLLHDLRQAIRKFRAARAKPTQ